MANQYQKPLPVPTEFTERFWQAAKENRLEVQRCVACGEMIFYPRYLCPHCLSTNLEWVQVSGKGRVYSYTVNHAPQNPAFRDDAPFVIAIVRLDEGPQIFTNIVNIPGGIENCRVDMRVEAVFEHVTPEHTLVKFQPVAS